jgi:predicted MFS family arabinose efflux permease
LSAGGIVITPLSARLLNEWGLEAALPWFGMMFFVLVVPVALWVLRGHPPPIRHPPAADATARPAWRYQDAVRSRFFVLITLGYVVCMGSQVGGIAHLYNRAAQVADYRAAAAAVQALTLLSILGRFFGGWLVTRVAIRPFVLGNVLGQALGLAVIATAGGPVQVIAGAALLGGTVGNLLMLHPLWLAEAFGGRAYARIFSLSNAVSVLGVAAGPALIGIIYDAFDYRLGYLTGTCGSLLALLLMLGAGASPRPARNPPG